MGETLGLILSFPAGMALGAFYFLNLYRTLQRLPDVPRPSLFLVRNLAVRMCVVLAGFYLVMGGQWEHCVIALLGFVLMRVILTRRLGRQPAAPQKVQAWRS